MQSLSALADGLWAWNYMIKIAYSFLFFSFSFVYVLTVDFKNIVIWYFFFLFIYIQHLVYYWYPRMDFWKFSSVIRIITTFKILSCLMSMIPSCFLSICHLVVSPFLKKNLMLFLFSFLVLHIYIYICIYINPCILCDAFLVNWLLELLRTRWQLWVTTNLGRCVCKHQFMNGHTMGKRAYLGNIFHPELALSDSISARLVLGSCRGTCYLTN